VLNGIGWYCYTRPFSINGGRENLFIIALFRITCGKKELNCMIELSNLNI